MGRMVLWGSNFPYADRDNQTMEVLIISLLSERIYRMSNIKDM